MLCWLQAQQRDFSFCVFACTSPVRKLAILIVENPWFNRLVLAIIMANCVFLAIANPQCDTEVEIANKPECAGNPKWQRVRIPLFSLFLSFVWAGELFMTHACTNITTRRKGCLLLLSDCKDQEKSSSQ